MKIINQDQFQTEVIQNEGVSLVDFYADWCVPCRMVAPVLEKLDQEYAGKVKFIKINVDSNQALSQAYNVRGIPTVLVFKQGKLVESQSGAGPAEFYQQLLDKHLV